MVRAGADRYRWPGHPIRPHEGITTGPLDGEHGNPRQFSHPLLRLSLVVLLMLFVALLGHLPGLVMTLRRGSRGTGRSLGKKAGRGERESNEEKAEKFFHGYKKKDTVWTKRFNLF